MSVCARASELFINLEMILAKGADCFSMPLYIVTPRVLTFFRVPPGERRAKLLWRANFAGLFLVSWAIGDWQARTYLLEQAAEEESTDNAA